MVCCFVPGCNSGYPSQRILYKKLGKRMPSMFSCKENDMEKWNIAIRRADRKLSSSDRVCELHFNANDIELYFSQTFPDGSVQVFEREKPLLKPGSVPTIFPNLPERFPEKSRKRKSPVEYISATKEIKIDLVKRNRAMPRAGRTYSAKDRVRKLHFKLNNVAQCFSHKFPDASKQLLEGERPLLKQGCIPAILSNLTDRFPKKLQKREFPVGRVSATKKNKEEEDSVISATPDTAEQVDKFNLSDNIHLVELPNKWWTIHSLPNYVACARWNDTFAIDRRVVIKNDNSIKVSLHDIDLQTEEKVTCIQDVSLLLQKVDDDTACSKATSRFCFYLNLHESDKHVL